VRPFVIKTSSDEIHTESLIICTGATARFLGLDAEKKLMGRGVSGCATCDGPLPFFRGKNLFVVGGGDAAMQEAGFLTRYAASVTIIHRRDSFRASKIMVQGVKSNPKIKFVLDSAVVDIIANAAGNVGSIKVRNLKTEAEQVLPADGVFIAIGHEPNTKLFKGQLELDAKGYIVTSGVKTSVPGVYAAGDVQDFLYKQAITAAGTGCEAALEAQWFLEELDRQKAQAATAT
jgi:thioredoxin reductase (NADPH)